MRRMKKCVKTQSDSNSLSFRELEFLTRFWLAIFFTLNHSVIAGEKAMLLQGAVDIFVQVIKRSCKGKGNGSGLAGDSAATYRYFYIILALLPLAVTEKNGEYDVKVTVRGGGGTGQGGAVSLALARALDDLNEDVHSTLKEHGLLTRDDRMVERKKYGQPKARKKFQFSKR